MAQYDFLYSKRDFIFLVSVLQHSHFSFKPTSYLLHTKFLQQHATIQLNILMTLCYIPQTFHARLLMIVVVVRAH